MAERAKYQARQKGATKAEVLKHLKAAETVVAHLSGQRFDVEIRIIGGRVVDGGEEDHDGDPDHAQPARFGASGGG